jgi:hypothetical protein
MRHLKLGLIGCSVFLLAGCPGEDRPADTEVIDPTVQTPPAEDVPMAAQQAPLEDLANVGITGEVSATPREGSTEVMLMVQNAPPNESLGARVHSGTCESPGPVLANLDAVGTDDMGQGHSETSVGHAPHLIMDGNHIVALYAPGTEPERDRPMACATLPSAGGMGATGTTGY